MTLLSITQIGIWLLGGAIALLLFSRNSFALSDISVPWNAISWSLVIGVPAYFLYATVAAGVGIIAGDSQQARQLSGYLGMGIFVPFWLSMLLVNQPNGAVAVGLTLFPLSAPVTAMVRMALTEIPVWQLWAAAAGVLLSLAGSLAFVSRMFRASMLMYGQSIRPKAIWRAMQEA
jgi:ABC-2 type transport system permease protein